MEIDLMDYFELSLGDTVDRLEDRFLIKAKIELKDHPMMICPKCYRRSPKFRLPLLTQCGDCFVELEIDKKEDLG